MDIASAQAASLVARPDSSTLSFHINQRFAAEVLKVTGDQVTLVLEGTPFVARLTTPEQAAALSGQRIANFVVRETAGTLPQIQMMPRTAAGAGETPAEPGRTSTLIPNLLRMAGLPVTESNTSIAQALVRQGLPVNAQLVNEMNNALTPAQGWGAQEAGQAALIKASGLPLTAGTLSLALSQANFSSLKDMIAGLRVYIAQTLQDNPQKTAQYGKQLNEMLTQLDQLNVDWSGANAQQSAGIARVLNAFSHPLERDLARFLQANLADFNQFSDQAAFEQNLAAFLQTSFPFLDSEEQTAMLKEIMHLLQENPALMKGEQMGALEKHLNAILQNHATGPAGLSPLEFDMEYLIKQYTGALGTPEGEAALTDDILNYIQNILVANRHAEGEDIGAQIAQYLQANAGGLTTPEGEAQLDEILTQFLRTSSLTSEGREALKAELTALIKGHINAEGVLENPAGLQKELTALLQKHLTGGISLQGQEALAQEISQLVKQQAGKPPGAEGQPLLSQDLARLIQKTLISASAEGLAGLPQDLAQFLQKNASLATPERRAALEQEAARLMSDSGFLRSAESQTGLTALARLRSELSASGMDGLLKNLDNLLERVRWMQFENTSPQTKAVKEQWLSLDLPLSLGVPGQGGENQALVQIRVAYQSEGKKRKIDPNNTHVMLHFDLGVGDEFVDVDLAVVERKIGAQITVSNEDLQPIAEDEIVPLSEGLEEVGYFLQTARCDTASPAQDETPSTEPRGEYVPEYVGKYNLRA